MAGESLRKHHIQGQFGCFKSHICIFLAIFLVVVFTLQIFEDSLFAGSF